MKLTKRQYIELYQKVFDTEDGKLILNDLANNFHMMGPTIRPGDNQEQYLIREGMRQVVLYILAKVNYDFEKYYNQRDNYLLEIKDERPARS